jgi:hypothetical protein
MPFYGADVGVPGAIATGVAVYWPKRTSYAAWLKSKLLAWKHPEAE